jgi:hypothetical protein
VNEVVRIAVTPEAVTLPAIPATIRLTVTATFRDSTTADVTESRGTAFSPADRTIAGAGGGIVSAAREGETLVIVLHGRAADTVRVTVDEDAPLDVEQFDVAPESIALDVGEEAAAGAIVVWRNGARLAATGLPFDYRTSDAGVVTASANGLLRGIGAGSAVVTVAFRDAERTIPARISALRQSVSFARDVLPLIQGDCTFSGCHSSAGTPQRGLRLNSLANLLAGSVNGPVVTPGDGARSRLVLALRGTLDGSRRMPLGRVPLSEFAIGTIQTWMDEGAIDN